MSSAYQKALDSGYSEKEIQQFLAKKNPKAEEAFKQGYSTKEVSDFLSNKNKGSEIGNSVGRSGARIAETVLGAPRAFGEFLESVVPEKALIKGAEKIGLGKGAETLLENTKKYAPYKLLPKSEDIRENVTKHLFGEKLEPKNKWESKADEFISDFAALAIPLPGAQFKLLRPGLLAAGGNIASDIVERMGGGKKEQVYAKLGTILTGSLIHPNSAKKLGNELYAKARESRPENASVNANNLIKKADGLEKQLLKGDPQIGSKKKSIELLNKLRTKVQNKEIPVEELEEFKRNINEARSGLYDEFKSDKVGRKAAKRNLDSVSKIVDDSLKEYGKVNPEWEAFYRPANEVHGAIAQSQRVSKWLQRNIKSVGATTLLSELGLLHFVGAPAALAAGKGIGAGFGALKGSELIARIMKSPTLRKHYFNIVNNALKEDAVAVRENIKKLQEELENQ